MDTITMNSTTPRKAAETHHTTVQLDTPLQRGDLQIMEIRLRRPRAGELRGVSLVDIAHLDVAALQKVLPRITDPVLNTSELNQMELADFMTLGAEVACFLARKADLDRAFPAA